MLSCEIPTKDMLPQDVVSINIDDPGCDLDCAMEKAFAKAEERDNAPVLLGWFDKEGQSYGPSGECCVEGEPSWLSFSYAHGGNFAVDVNQEQYVFVFRQSHGLP
jgi:hypothetical protein